MLMLSGHNEISYVGAAAIADALATNDHLLELDLGNDAML
jgi:hypothetical protein